MNIPPSVDLHYARPKLGVKLHQVICRVSSSFEAGILLIATGSWNSRARASFPPNL